MPIRQRRIPATGYREGVPVVTLKAQVNTYIGVLWRILRQDSGRPRVVRENMNYTPVPENRDGVFFLYLGEPGFGHLSVHSVLSKGLFFLERRDCFFGSEKP